ncbi:MAG TPA: sterol desaturase family protein [Stellaceae bacterium]|nr:sterol desaturase family protein [Stellaceae bacterium]
MPQHFLAHASMIRLAVFLAVFVAMAAWEATAPCRPPLVRRTGRWPHNLGILVLDTALLRVFFPTAAVGFAALGESRHWGLLDNTGIPPALKLVVAVIMLDLAIYLQHVLFHAVPMLWRVHRVHHADLDFDATTGLRFHPFESLLSMGFKFFVIAALGAPAAAVLIFEILLNAGSLFSHGNVGLPARLDRALRAVLVTPGMHRVHHSMPAHETNSNFGFNLSWWDRLFGTYRWAPAAGDRGMTIGLDTFRDPVELRLDRMLAQPFRGATGRYPMGRRGA